MNDCRKVLLQPDLLQLQFQRNGSIAWEALGKARLEHIYAHRSIFDGTGSGIHCVCSHINTKQTPGSIRSEDHPQHINNHHEVGRQRTTCPLETTRGQR